MRPNANPKTTSPSRRDFIRTAAAATAVAPYFVPASVFGQNAPSNRINVGCIGTGNQGFADLDRFLNQPDCQVVAICDVNKGSKGYKEPNDVRGREPAKQLVDDFYAKQSPSGSYQGCSVHKDFRELIARNDIDAVMIVTPDHWHEAMTIAAAQAGKDIYCEKPLGLTIAGQQRMVEAVRQHKRVLQTGSQERSNPYVRRLCELVRGGAIGDVKRVVCNIGRNNKIGPGPGWQPMPVPNDFDYAMWLGPAPDAPFHKDRCFYNFRFIQDYSDGQITNFGAHSLDIAQLGLGMDGSGPTEVEYLYADYLPKGSLFDAATHSAFRCKYANGVVLECMTSSPSVYCMFYGTKGVAGVGAAGRDLVIIPNSLMNDDMKTPHHYHAGPDHVRNFLDSVKSRQDPNAPVEVGHRSATICHLGNIAMKMQTKLAWDPKSEKFQGNRSEAANKLLDRPQRTDWQT